MYVVYVLDKDGNHLMPTKRFGHVRRMLKSGQAKAVSTKPFTIQLQYESTRYTQPLYGGKSFTSQASDAEVLEASRKLMERNQTVYEELASGGK